MADPGLKLTISVSDSGEDNRIRFFFLDPRSDFDQNTRTWPDLDSLLCNMLGTGRGVAKFK